MQQESILYIAYSVTSIVIAVVLALLFWDRRKVSGAKCMSIMMISASLWGLSDFLSDISSDFSIKLFWENISYFGIAMIPVAWMIFVIYYTKGKKYAKRRNILLLTLIPMITFLMVWTNDFHHLMVSKMDFIKTGQMVVLDPSFGPWFWVHAVYSYLLLVVGTLLLVKNLRNLPEILRNQSIVMILAMLVPMATNILYTFKVNPAYPIDPTIFSFTIAGLLCFIGMFRYKLFELVPQARNAVIEDMNGLLLVLDNRNHIIDINSAAKDFFGVSENNFVGKYAADLLGQWTSNFTKYKDVLKAEEKITIDTMDGKRHFDLRINPLFDHRNKTIGKFFILYDITVIEDAIFDLEESRVMAEAANKAKSQFLATMSHEIRTPLSGITGMSELLTSAKLTEEEQGYLQTVQSCAGSLLDIINDILDFSKIEAGKMEIEEIGFNLKNLIDTTVKTFYHQSKEKGVQLVCHMDETIPEHIVGDPVKIKQILVNLIGNAFKFTDKGKVVVRVEQLENKNRKLTIRFSVTDTGIGVPQDKIDKLFKSFQQVDSSTTRKYGGTGLGLAIVKDLVSLMGGNIEVESEPGEGSRFSFTVPFEISDNETYADIPKDEFNFTGEDIIVLLTEDSKVNQMLIAKLLENKGIKVDKAGNGVEALGMLEKKEYDLILMDIQMPEMDGYEATKTIRRNEANTGRHIPVIALTANATAEDRNACMAAGMDDFLTKPIKTEVMFECLYRHFCGNKLKQPG